MEVLFLVNFAKALINFLKAKAEIAVLISFATTIATWLVIIGMAIVLFLGTVIPWTVWCIGYKTKRKIAEMFG